MHYTETLVVKADEQLPSLPIPNPALLYFLRLLMLLCHY